MPRGDTARADADAQGGLAGSAKDRAEHRYVVDDIAATLRPFCDELTVPDEPSLVAFRSVAHLGTRIEGRAGPTPTGGPRAARAPPPDAGRRRHAPGRGAGRSSPRTRPATRGYWAGPVGWADAGGDGEWMIGIRSARLHADGRRPVTLRAGAGIVADSDPEAEAAETNVKLATVLDAVVPGGVSAAAVSGPASAAGWPAPRRGSRPAGS